MTIPMPSDLTQWTVGPYHSALPGPMVCRLALDGERISSLSTELGYLHRGLEFAMQQGSWVRALPYAAHVDPENAVFGELAYCMALERLSGLSVPPRAEGIRVVACELSRIANHLNFIARLSESMEASTQLHYALRDREAVLDLFELLTGARFSLTFMRPGGVKFDITEGFIERVIEFCELIRIRLREYNDLFTYHAVVEGRLRGLGQLSAATVERFGISGPNARATGQTLDLRRQAPYLRYAKLDLDIPERLTWTDRISDAHSRLVFRIREIAQSAEILRQALEELPAGEFMGKTLSPESHPPAGEAWTQVESSRGRLSCHLVSSSKNGISRVSFCTPTSAMIQALPVLARGVQLTDFSVLLASVDLSIAEADR